MYSILFNRITDAIECLSRGQAAQAKDILTAAQCEAEELFIAGAAEPERQLKA